MGCPGTRGFWALRPGQNGPFRVFTPKTQNVLNWRYRPDTIPGRTNMGLWYMVEVGPLGTVLGGEYDQTCRTWSF